MILFPKTIWGTLYGKTKVRDWSIGVYAEICMNMIFLFKRNRKKMESVSHEDIATYAASPKNYPSLISQCYPAQSETPCPMQRYLYSVNVTKTPPWYYLPDSFIVPGFCAHSLFSITLSRNISYLNDSFELLPFPV